MTDGLHTYQPLMPLRHPWMDHAACTGHPDLFFPEGKSNDVIAGEKQAVQVCSTCPVQADCLAYAIANDERYGVWGGKTPTELNALKGRRRPR